MRCETIWRAMYKPHRKLQNRGVRRLGSHVLQFICISKGLHPYIILSLIYISLPLPISLSLSPIHLYLYTIHPYLSPSPHISLPLTYTSISLSLSPYLSPSHLYIHSSPLYLSLTHYVSVLLCYDFILCYVMSLYCMFCLYMLCYVSILQPVVCYASVLLYVMYFYIFCVVSVYSVICLHLLVTSALVHCPHYLRIKNTTRRFVKMNTQGHMIRLEHGHFSNLRGLLSRNLYM